MYRPFQITQFVLFSLFFIVTSLSFAQDGIYRTGSQEVLDPLVEKAQKLAREGLHKDAYDLVRPWLLDAKNGEGMNFHFGFQVAIDALRNRV